MADCHYTADSAIIFAFKLAVPGRKGRQRGPEEQVVAALARCKSARQCSWLRP